MLQSLCRNNNYRGIVTIIKRHNMKFRTRKYQVRVEDCHVVEVNNKVFVIHPDSGAFSSSSKYRSKFANKIAAILNITLTKEFKQWYDCGGVYEESKQHPKRNDEPFDWGGTAIPRGGLFGQWNIYRQ
jgi:hypothetical protein